MKYPKRGYVLVFLMSLLSAFVLLACEGPAGKPGLPGEAWVARAAWRSGAARAPRSYRRSGVARRPWFHRILR